jgi:ADP-ribosylglycohydrolase
MNNSIIESYKYGDRIGAAWESQNYGWHNRSYDEIMQRANYYPEGTDETDIVNCFMGFTQNYSYSTRENLLLDWLIYQTRTRRPTRYGSTYKDHFKLMDWLINEGRVDLDKIRRLAQDRNSNGSFGNGCLALVYPVHCYAKQIRQDSLNLIKEFTRLIYTHENALSAVTFLHQIIEATETSTDMRKIKTDNICIQEFLNTGLSLEPEDYIKEYTENVKALHTLFNALYCAYDASDEKEVITRCVNFGGDVDSVLATAMLIFSLMSMTQSN